MEIRIPTRDEFIQIIDNILIPSFPASERPESSGFMAMFDDGIIFPLATFIHHQPVAVSLSISDFTGQSDAGTEVILIAWLAVGQAGRGGGIGSRLLHETVRVLTQRYDPLLILLEVEDPQIHTHVSNYGNPTARLRFYEHAGARRIDIPFAMPREDLSQEVLPGMLLYGIGARALAHAAPESVDIGTPLTKFLYAYAQAAGEPQSDDGHFIHPAIENMIQHAPHARFVS
ncbi:hypothetical protein [Arcanobacterium buesumense]|uniref:N-acetyltransferase domain-containing protein n=1 Tax=Arcanobacterium buesumense TaxID=2722751 RepID=A0A6H2EKN1_9ACTO|nr:hypothetical protein [Arcanobacterium buesumense]QJC21469.1 hypothetical protein HC352_02355 [Arcanobacterium buesumense]